MTEEKEKHRIGLETGPAQTMITICDYLGKIVSKTSVLVNDLSSSDIFSPPLQISDGLVES